jgi:hypothetical protein
MSIFKNMPANIAHQMAESERMLIRAWDLQRRERADPHADPVTDDQVDRAATILEEIVGHLPENESVDVERLIAIVRTRLGLRTGQE